MESAILSGVLVVVITQSLRQLLPNLFAFTWQIGISNLVPNKYSRYRWFTDKESLFYSKEGEISFATYPVLSNSNLRSVVLLFGLIVILFTQLPMPSMTNTSSKAIISLKFANSNVEGLLNFVC